MLLSGWKRWLAAFAAGVLCAFSMAPFDMIVVCFLSFPVLVWLLDGTQADCRSGWRPALVAAFAVGWWFGFGYFVFGLWWIGKAMLIEAESFAWALPVGIVVLPAILALFYGLAAIVARLFWSGGIGRIISLAAAFGVAEWLRSFVFTGFPWNPIGFAAMPVPLLMQSVAVTGLPGMNSLSVLVFAMPALVAGKRHIVIGGVVSAILVAGHFGFGMYRMEAAESEGGRILRARIVQPSIDQATKIEGDTPDEVFQTLLTLSSLPVADGGEKPELILWPETSIPFLLSEAPYALAALGQLLDDGQMLIAGAVRAENGAVDGPRYYNSAIAIDSSGKIVDMVDKVHLVPGGEYLPFRGFFQFLGIERLIPMPLAFHPGENRHAIELPGGLRAVPFICYEIIFPRLVADGAANADLTINITNDGWFGDSPGPYQHLRQAQIRAVETGRGLLRAANTGISGAIDTKGRIIDKLAVNSRGVIDVTMKTGPFSEFPQEGTTKNGLVIITILGTIAFGLGLLQRTGVDRYGIY